jgi:hypothetical protein
MDKKPLIARFRVLVERAFSRRLESIDDQVDYNDKYQHAFKAEYDAAVKIVLSVKTGDVLTELMNTYLSLYGQYAANRNEVRFYRSDQLFQLLIEQTRKVADESLFETWAGFIAGSAEGDGYNSFKKRFGDLDVYFRNQITKFIHDEREKRRQRRSVLDVLRDEFFKQNGRVASSDDELRDFDPRATSNNAPLEGQIAAVRKAWSITGSNYTEEHVDSLNEALGDLAKYLRSLGKSKLLSLFQAVRNIRLLFDPKPDIKADPTTGERKTYYPPPLYEHENVLLRGLYTLACVQLLSSAQADKMFTRNRLGFTAEEVRFFCAPLEKRFAYRSNLRRVLTPPYKGPGPAFDEIRIFLDTYILTKNQLNGLELVALDRTLEIQEKWRAVHDTTDLIRLASNNNDLKRLEEIFKDPRHAKGIEYLKEISSTTIGTKNPWELGKATLAAGDRIGTHDKYGDIAIVYIDPATPDRAYVEISTLRPQLFVVRQAYIDDKIYGERVLEIYRSTIGVVDLVEMIFLAMGFMPVLIEAGFAGLIYEIALFYASSKVEEQASRINKTFGEVLGLLLQTFTPRPGFKPKVVSGAVKRADRSALSETLNVKPLDRSVADKAASMESRGIARLTEAETDVFVSGIRIEQDILEMNAGLPMRAKDFRAWVAKFKPGGTGFPREWRLKFAESEPARKMVEAAEDVKLVRITAKQRKALPYKYQSSSMGSDYELHLTLNGQEYKLDGIITDGQGKSWIGESKFTFKDAFDEAYASLDLPGKANPTTSFHYQFLDEKVLPQFRRYAGLAKKFGFEGVAVHANTEFLWATFEQATRRMPNVEILFTEFELAAKKVVRPPAAKAVTRPAAKSRATAR